MMRRTFIDSGVLIAAARGDGLISKSALMALDSSDREFASSIFVKMEVLPKAVYHKKAQEVLFYETFFGSVIHWAKDLECLTEIAYKEATMYGIASMDSLHIAAAICLQCDELLTTERADKAIHRTKSIKVVSL